VRWFGRRKQRLALAQALRRFLGQGSFGIVLGAGGAKGWAHIGVLRWFEDHGLRPSCICGASSGALVGAVYACGTLSSFGRELCRLTPRRITTLLDPTWRRGGLIAGKRLKRFLERFLPIGLVEELPVRYAAVATDLNTGTPRVLTSGSLLEAVRASIAIPGVFAPVNSPPWLLADGGLVDPLPVDAAYGLGAGTLVAVDVQGHELKPLPLSRRGGPKVVQVLWRSSEIMSRQTRQLRLASRSPDLVIYPPVLDIGSFEFHRAGEAIACGYEAAERVREEIFGLVRRPRPEPLQGVAGDVGTEP